MCASFMLPSCTLILRVIKAVLSKPERTYQSPGDLVKAEILI